MLKINQIHNDCYKLCQKTFGRNLPNSGNIGIFCQNQDEYEHLSKLKDEITHVSKNPKQKYFELLNPVTIEKTNKTPKTIYTHLYIRKPDPTDYGKYLGDIDFYLSNKDFTNLVNELQNGKIIKNVKLYKQDDKYYMIQLSSKSNASVAYVSTKDITEKIRFKL